VFLGMDLGKHFYNSENKFTKLGGPNYALELIKFITERRKYLTVGKIVDKSKYISDIEQKLANM
jgi:hypothetical protein